MENREIIAAFPLKCEGIRVGENPPPLENNKTTISVTVFRDGNSASREIGCAHLKKGKCEVSKGKPCMHLFPESSVKFSAIGEKVVSPAGLSVAIDGEKLRAKRIEAGITQQELANAAHSGPTLIWKLERPLRGPVKTKTERAQLMANRLGVPVQEILHDSEITVTNPVNKGRRGRGRRKAG